ncbi:hypothetical protein [Arenimonas oryziterrae]|uniref:Galactosyldiacylglycerol synthase n=1 Tax=Arenimonas oryziterrae DSM 21050 = YC6267 TaxID=1121015 RepID=A0A091BKW3_9GAMM|nr:hypothetical protein [Arenimonas oryziterrae]KFN44930.1 hypothetical protein N789_02605 [Arenimonas oryziterrae DSM 21050 = YC6267]
MITLREKDSGKLIGSITESDLKILIDALEEESSTDQDYYVDAATLDKIQEDTPYAVNTVTLLRAALGSNEGIDIVWSRG